MYIIYIYCIVHMTYYVTYLTYWGRIFFSRYPSSVALTRNPFLCYLVFFLFFGGVLLRFVLLLVTRCFHFPMLLSFSLIAAYGCSILDSWLSYYLYRVCVLCSHCVAFTSSSVSVVLTNLLSLLWHMIGNPIGLGLGLL